MKKSIFSVLASMMICVMIICTVGNVAYAADENFTQQELESKAINFKNGIVINTSWKTVASSNSGFNCDIYIRCQNVSFLPNSWTVSPTDIRMLNKNGKVVWQESGAVAGIGERVFWCGNDVYTIQARCQAGSGSLYIHQN